MTDTTPHYGWPYPEPEDARGAGANTVRDGFLAVETSVRTDNTAAQALLAESPGPANVGDVVTFAGDKAMSGFTYDAGVWTYTGPGPRPFLVTATVETENGGAATVDSAVYLRVEGVDVDSSYDRVVVTDGTVAQRNVVHRLVCPMVLYPGQTVRALAFATPAGAVGNTALRIYPMGPLLP